MPIRTFFSSQGQDERFLTKGGENPMICMRRRGNPPEDWGRLKSLFMVPDLI